MAERKSVIQRIRNSFSILGHLFYKTSKDDFEKTLQHLSKEEAAVHTRLKWRSQTWRKLARAIILYSIIVELFILGIAVIATRAPELSWQMRAVRVLPVFLFPASAALAYSTSASYYRMRERKDQKTLDRLRNERQAKIDELKERTNYYLTQQLIQKYDPDPAAKEAAARILASKIGAEAGLKLSLESSHVDETQIASAETKSQDVNLNDSTGLRRRIKHPTTPSTSPPPLLQGSFSGETTATTVRTGQWDQGMEVEHYSGKPAGGGGWIARLAAMLVGEDPTQCYALICKNCHMHNGLARKEDFQYVSYYCPHCHTLNGTSQLGENRDSGTVLLEGSKDGDFQEVKKEVLLGNSPIKGVAMEAMSPGSSTTVSDRVEDLKND